MNVYRAKNDQGIKTICHIDAYRLNSASDLLNIGAQDFFDDQETLTVIEWGDKVRDILPRRSKIVVIEALSENNRKICFKK
jgi:tRNA threonylcarbamoyladenosine biosynthesis protein TsaE